MEKVQNIKQYMFSLIEKAEKINKKMATIPHDKALHFLYGHLTYNFLLLIFAPYIALAITAMIAMAKEFYDYKVPGHETSFMDFVYGVAPGTIQTLVGFA